MQQTGGGGKTPLAHCVSGGGGPQKNQTDPTEAKAPRPYIAFIHQEGARCMFSIWTSKWKLYSGWYWSLRELYELTDVFYSHWDSAHSPIRDDVFGPFPIKSDCIADAALSLSPGGI